MPRCGRIFSMTKLMCPSISHSSKAKNLRLALAEHRNPLASMNCWTIHMLRTKRHLWERLRASFLINPLQAVFHNYFVTRGCPGTKSRHNSHPSKHKLKAGSHETWRRHKPRSSRMERLTLNSSGHQVKTKPWSKISVFHWAATGAYSLQSF